MASPPSDDHRSPPPPRAASLGKLASTLVVSLVYAVALLYAAVVARSVRAAPPAWILLLATSIGTCVVFLFSRLFRNSSLYDPYWSLAPMVIAPYLALREADPGVVRGRQAIVVALVVWWGGRLTYNWWRRWEGMRHEDWRYRALREYAGRPGYFWIDLLGIHGLPTVQVYLGCLPLLPALCWGTRPFGWLDVAALVVTGTSIWLEMRSDRELHDFSRSRRDRREILDSGLWAYARHPNYTGEIGFWCGLALFGYAADPTFRFSALGAVTIALMFVFVSVPILEARHRGRRPGYEEHARRVNALLLWPPRNKGGRSLRDGERNSAEPSKG